MSNHHSLRSMTGYGSGLASIEEFEISVEIQSVNRRGLELGIFLPRDWQSMEAVLAEQVKAACQRGKISISVKVVANATGAGIQWDENALRATLERLGRLAERLNITWKPDADALIRLIPLHKSEGDLPLSESVREALQGAVSSALEALVQMRCREGESLRRDFLGRLKRLEALLAIIREHADGAVDRYRQMLMERLSLVGLDLDLKDERVLKEVALFADRCDVSEEITRLTSHFAQFGETLANDVGEPVGRKLEFILQEINREYNTLGSKSNRIEISQAVIEAKNEIERIREQVQNIE